ncbi:MAG: hypothetical protein KDE55_08625 [Novosphingobium sp.]|nr:hypothetical protein [Novosphingobium sp.]
MNWLPSRARLVTALGAAFMALLAFGIVMPPDYPFFGSQLYDYYARALLNGHFDLPVRALRIEGHYAPDGRGYLYHGLGPVLTRLPFAPFVDLPTTWLSPLSIWLWAVAGNLGWHRAFAVGIERAKLESAEARNIAHLVLAIAIWFASPGILLAANGTLYYEPSAMAYAMGGGVMCLIVLVATGHLPARKALLPMAVLAGLAIHTRPHLGLAFVATACLFALFVAWKGQSRDRLHAVGVFAVIGVFGVALLASNALRFGNAAEMHGSFGKSEVQYGSVYWGYENPDGARAQAFVEHGRFNPGRIAPNLLFYLAAPPDGPVTSDAVSRLEALHTAMIAPFGLARLEKPRGGALFLWPLWLLLMVVGLAQRDVWRMPALAGLAGAGIGAALLLSYPTITLRYHVDLWPLIAFPAVFGVAPALRMATSKALPRYAFSLLLVLGVGTTGVLVGASRNLIVEAPGSVSQAWTQDYCLTKTAAKGFTGDKANRMCSLDEAGSSQS